MGVLGLHGKLWLAFVIAQQPAAPTLDELVARMNATPPEFGAVIALGKLGEAAIPSLIAALRGHPGAAIRYLAHEALAAIGRPALPELDRAMQDGDTGARIQGVLCWEKILGREGLPRLRGAAGDPDAGVRARAHGALVRLDDEAAAHLAALAEILRTGAEGARWLAAESLAWCGARAASAVPALAAALRDPSRAVADRALSALGTIGTETAMQHVTAENLRRLAAGEGDRAAQLHQIAEIGRSGPAGAAALPALQTIAGDALRDILVRGYAAWAAEAVAPRPAGEAGGTYHVATADPAAADTNPGTAAQPWKTIQHAAETLRPGDTVLIHAGLYRELVRPFRGGTGPARVITYAAAPGERPVLSGSDPWQPEWRREGDGLWSAPYQRHSWDHPEQWPEPQTGPMHRAEQVFVDSALLTHVATQDELRAAAGRTLTDDEAGRLWIHLADDRSPAEHGVERSARQQVFAPAVRGLGWIVVRGLTLQRGAAPESNGNNWAIIAHRAVLSTRSGHHWLIEDNLIEWGNAQGVDIGGEGWGSDLADQPIVSEERGHHLVRRNVVSHHGVAGIVGWGGREQSLVLEDNVTDDNGLKGNFFAYESAGVKLHNAKDCIIRRHRSHHNHCFGIWLDHQCERNRVTQCLLTDNAAAGLFFEVSAGPLLADNNVVLGTRDVQKSAWGDGIYSHDGNRASYVNNYCADCAGFGIRLCFLHPRVADGAPVTGSHNLVANNLLLDNARGALSLHPEVPRATGNRCDANLFAQAGGPPRMELRGAGPDALWETLAEGKALGLAGDGSHTVPLDDWRRATGHDADSRVIARDCFGPEREAERILAALLKLWPATAPPLDGGYAELTPLTAEALLALLPH